MTVQLARARQEQLYPYQELLGNYDDSVIEEMARKIIPYQELLENHPPQ